MKKSKTAKIIEKIALQEGVSIAEVRANLLEAIDCGYENRNQSVISMKFWLQWGGRKPTLDEFLIATSKKVYSSI